MIIRSIGRLIMKPDFLAAQFSLFLPPLLGISSPLWPQSSMAGDFCLYSFCAWVERKSLPEKRGIKIRSPPSSKDCLTKMSSETRFYLINGFYSFNLFIFQQTSHAKAKNIKAILTPNNNNQIWVWVVKSLDEQGQSFFQDNQPWYHVAGDRADSTWVVTAAQKGESDQDRRTGAWRRDWLRQQQQNGWTPQEPLNRFRGVLKTGCDEL